MKKARLCVHSGRGKKNGKSFNVSHNDRRAERGNEADKHIRTGLSGMNKYDTCYGADMDFKEAEIRFYEENYGATIRARNERYIAQGHADRVRTVMDLYQDKKTAPMETLLYLGDVEHLNAIKQFLGSEFQARKVMREIIWDAYQELRKAVFEPYSANIHELTVALHADEDGMCHLHTRQVCDYVNEKGEKVISQNKALEKCGFQPPNLESKVNRFNNRKQTYSAFLRESWISACRIALARFKSKNPNLEKIADVLGNFELTPEKPRKRDLEKNEYIIIDQERTIRENNRMIEHQEAFKIFHREALEVEAEAERERARGRGRGR